MSTKTNQIIPITQEDLVTIYGDEYLKFLSKIVTNAYCGDCHGSVTIQDYSATLNDLDDISLQGVCATCGARVGRYIETGEDDKFVTRIKSILEPHP